MLNRDQMRGLVVPFLVAADPKRVANSPFMTSEDTRPPIGLWIGMFLLMLMCTILTVIAAAIGYNGYFHSLCPFNPQIPYFLFIAGCLSTFIVTTSVLIFSGYYILYTKGVEMSKVWSVSAAGVILTALATTLFLIGWCCAGAYWIAKFGSPLFEPASSRLRFCDKTVYYTAIAECALVFGGLGTNLCIGLCRRPYDFH